MTESTHATHSGAAAQEASSPPPTTSQTPHVTYSTAAPRATPSSPPTISQTVHDQDEHALPLGQQGLEVAQITIVTPDSLPQESIDNFFIKVAKYIGITPEEAVYLFYLLALKGGTNKGTPASLTSSILNNSTDDIISISKGVMLTIFIDTFGHPHIRRLAEKLATPISLFAAAQGVPGDLAQQLDSQNRISGGAPLLFPAKAWCWGCEAKGPLIF
jgi:hypothetical protein